MKDQYDSITEKPKVSAAPESAIGSLAALTLAQNALTDEERSRVLVLYARGLRLLFSVGSPRHSAAQWAAAWAAVSGELLALVTLRHQRLSETVRVTTHHFFSPPYQVSHAQLRALHRVMTQRLDAEMWGLIGLTRLLDPPRRKKRRPQQRTVKRVQRRESHRKKFFTAGQRKQRTAGRPRAGGKSGKGGAVPTRVRVEEVLAWVRQVKESLREDDLLTFALKLLKTG